MMTTRRSALSLLAAAPTALRAFAAKPEPQPTRLYLGTQTKPTGSKGIYTCPWDAAAGTLGPIELAAETASPTFLALAPDRLFAVNELSGSGPGQVSAFTRKTGSAALHPLNTVSSGSPGPCHLALDHTHRSLFVANYSGGSLSAYTVGPKGLSAPVATLPFAGHGADPDRQSAAHTHCVLLSPDNRFLLVNDLGLDRIMVYAIDPATAALTPATTPFVSTAPGSGPRHATFHPNGRWVYSVNELNSTLDRLEWTSGSLTMKESVSTLPTEAQGQKNSPAELAIDRAGHFLYVSNRFHDSLGVFRIDPATGALTAVQDISCGGRVPRHFALDPSERWVLSANQDSGNIAVFERNSSTGTLTATGRSYNLANPVCIVFA